MHILIFIAVLFVLVLVHELGHFFVAKKAKMRIDEFGIGFPPRLFSFKKGETLYSLNAIPLGGFVKIYGEDSEGAEKDADSARAFNNRPLLAQALVLVAGVTANILLAWLLFSIVFAVGMKTSVTEEDATAQAQLMVLSVMPGSSADVAGMTPGDVLTHVSNENGRLAEKLYPSTVSSFIQENGAVSVRVDANGVEKRYELVSKSGLVDGEPERKVVGITMGLIEEVSRPIHVAVYDAGIHTLLSIKAITVGIATLLVDTVLMRADFSQIAGPVGIAGLVGDAASMGLTSLLVFTAFISLNLAVINMLPFPALDGGRLLFVAIEAVTGRPVPSRIAQYANAVGFFLLILLMVLVTYNDILRIIK